MSAARSPIARFARDAAEVLTEIGASLFAAWRRVVTATAVGSRILSRALAKWALDWAQQWVWLWRYHTAPEQSGQSADRAGQAAAAIGTRALLFGVLLAGLVTSRTTGAATPGLMLVLTEVLWAAMRFVIVGLLVRPGSIDRARLVRAYLAGLLPYAIGWTPPLRLLSLAASALVTRRGLQIEGVEKRDANLAVAWAFGGQIGVFVLAWAVRASVAAIAVL